MRAWLTLMLCAALGTAALAQSRVVSLACSPPVELLYDVDLDTRTVTVATSSGESLGSYPARINDHEVAWTDPSGQCWADTRLPCSPIHYKISRTAPLQITWFNEGAGARGKEACRVRQRGKGQVF